jgi:RHS repeat-associated protein
MKLIKRCATFLLATLMLCAGLGPGRLSANEAGETITFYHHDHLGTPIMATNEAGEVLWIREYSAFGDPKTQGDAVAVGYAGHEYYPESPLTNMGARWYHSELGRFMSPDPVGFNAGNTLSFNRYLYGNNNPYTFYDPDGEYAWVFLEASSATLSLDSAVNNFKQGHYGAAAVDVLFAAVDVGFMAIPPVPGIFGMLRQSAKRAPDVIGVAKALPKKVIGVLKKINKNKGMAPKGYRGGRRYTNDGRDGGQVLPKEDTRGNSISYKEYDVNPYEKGVNRGAERIVQGSTGRSYYTSDHYKTFTEIK